MPARQRDAIDELVGRNIRLMRLQRKMTQTELARKIGLTFQQVQKYENGANRVGAGRLFKIAAIFSVPVGALFDGADHKSADKAAPSPAALLTDPYALCLAQAFAEIESKSIRLSLVELTELLASRPSKTSAKVRKNSARDPGMSRSAQP